MAHPIAAIATGLVRSGIGILRMSGDGCIDLANRVFALYNGQALSSLPDRKLARGTLFDAQNRPIDEAMVFVSHAPHSYTGEDTVEFQCHGSPAVLTAGLSALLSNGFHQAGPGEFTKRAFLNGQMDLTQAEAVIDLIDAETADAAANAAGQVAGVLRKQLDPIYDSLMDICSHFHAVLDYPDEDIEPFRLQAYADTLTSASKKLDALLSSCRRGNFIKNGMQTAILGAPNAGKSSLLNALAGFDRVIVTDIPGTTRDRIEHWVSLNRVPVKMVDTAGIRTTDDVVESKGIERTLVEIRKADVVLHLKDASGLIRDDTEVLDKVLKEVRHGVPLITVNNKVDLCESAASDGEIAISAKQGVGLSELKARLLEVVGMAATTDGVFMARERHLQCLKTAAEHVSRALLLIDCDPMPELVAEELRLASRALGEILGETTTEDILGMIFSKFCIGK